MAHVQKIKVTRYYLGRGKNARRVPKGTPGAKAVKEESSKWYGIWREGRRQVRVPLSTDRPAAQAMLTDLLRNKERGKAGLVDPFKGEKQRAATEHLDAYLLDLRAQDRDAEYIQNVKNDLKRVFKRCGFGILGDFNADRLDKFLAELSCSARRKNALRRACLSFCNWLVKKKKLDDNPFRHVTTARGEVKRQRRALPIEDLQRLLEVAHRRPVDEACTIRRGQRKGQRTDRVKPDVLAKRRQLGHSRYLLYKTAVLTGLRRQELSHLRVEHLYLDAEPYLRLPGKYTKNGKDADLPLRKEHANELRAWINENGLEPKDRVFKVAKDKASIETLKRDLAAAGLPYLDEQGRYFDFHCLRKCTSSFLHQAKVHPRIIQLFMRHADPNLTTHYDDATLHDLRQACDALPWLHILTPEERRLKAHREEAVKAWVEEGPTGFYWEKVEEAATASDWQP
jgi:integrase